MAPLGGKVNQSLEGKRFARIWQSRTQLNPGTTQVPNWPRVVCTYGLDTNNTANTLTFFLFFCCLGNFMEEVELDSEPLGIVESEREEQAVQRKGTKYREVGTEASHSQ